MTGLYVDQLVSRPAETVTTDTPLQETADQRITNDVGAVVVVDDSGRIEGILTATDLVRAFSEGAISPDGTVADLMRADVATTTRDTLVSEVAATMIERLIHHVPVVDGDEVVGMITTLDLESHLTRSQ